MTVDDLAKVFRAGLFDYLGQNPDATVTEGDRAGIAAVVRAVRDEIVEDGNCKYCVATTAMYNEILGDAGEKVGTHGSPELDEDARKLEAMGQDPGMTLEELLAPATDAAPDVCVWIDQVKGMAWAGCNNKLYPIKSAVNGCNGCGKPIKFTEAK